jgi:hypothetical protein
MTRSSSDRLECTDVETAEVPRELLEDLVDRIEELTQEIEDVREENRRLREDLEDLEDDHADHRAETARERAADRKRLTALEDLEDDPDTGSKPQGSDGPSGPAEPTVTPETPLENLASMPAEIVDNESANVRRAVFVVRDLTEYTTSVPAGRVIRSSALRKILKAGTDCRGHSQTVDRVIRVLEDLGKDAVDVVKRRGERRVVFTEQLVARLQKLGGTDHADGHGVVTGGTP